LGTTASAGEVASGSPFAGETVLEAGCGAAGCSAEAAGGFRFGLPAFFRAAALAADFGFDLLACFAAGAGRSSGALAEAGFAASGSERASGLGFATGFLAEADVPGFGAVSVRGSGLGGAGGSGTAESSTAAASAWGVSIAFCCVPLVSADLRELRGNKPKRGACKRHLGRQKRSGAPVTAAHPRRLASDCPALDSKPHCPASVVDTKHATKLTRIAATAHAENPRPRNIATLQNIRPSRSLSAQRKRSS
jgi:hypothetical protein